MALSCMSSWHAVQCRTRYVIKQSDIVVLIADASICLYERCLRLQYCPPVRTVIATINQQMRTTNVHFLDHRGFLDGSHGPACCGHPSIEVDAAMARAAVPVISAALGWL